MNHIVNTFPYIENFQLKSTIEHEASTTKISEENLFYLQQHGLTEEQAKNMLVNGFCKSVFQKLPAASGLADWQSASGLTAFRTRPEIHKYIYHRSIYNTSEGNL